eukprot:gene18832-22533_t
MDYGPAPESQKEAQAWLDGRQRKFGLFIDNAWSEPAELFASTNPADGTQLAELTQATDADVERAVEAARRALPVWQGMGGHGRAKVMYALARLLQKHSRLFAVLETLDNGKTIRETRDIDLPLAARHFYHHAGWAQLQSEEFGQVCCAGSRLLVQESIQERFLNKVRARMENLRLGSPLDKSMDVGALVDPVQRQRIAALVDSARAEGCDVWQPACELPADGSWFPPTLITGASTSAAVAQAEIFGPVLVAMSFRTPPEAVQLANNTVYGLAASVWTESISLALDIAPAIKAGVVWINSANQFDAACGFGGYRESGFGREGGREGMLEYMTALAEDARPALPVVEAKAKGNAKPASADPFAIDRTAKMYIGGKQARPDSAYSAPVFGANGALLAEVGVGSRKDIRNAVEAAHKASGWTGATAHNRAQVLYYIAENLAARADEFAARIAAMTGNKNPEKEVQASIERLFYYAAWADKYDGLAHQPPTKGITVALNEAVGVIGIVCPNEAPLLGFISLVAPAIALGNRVVVVPSEAHPLSALDLYQVFDTSDLPGGVVNIISGNADELARTLATHADIDAVWRHDGSAEGCAEVERLSAGTLKRTWVGGAKGRDWYSAAQSGGRAVLAHASQVKNVWIPYGV